MRFAGLCGLGLLALTTSSVAADLPFLRGSAGPVLGGPAYFRWSGLYFGGQGSFSSAGANFTNGTGELVAYILRNTTIENEANVSQWTTLGKNSSTGGGYGGFIGYNAQFDDAVVGIELNYTRTNFTVSAADSLTRSYTTADQYFYNVFVSGEASAQLTDLASLRFRGGWAAYSFMPYAFLGVALGRANITRSATVDLTAIDVSNPPQNRPNLALDETRSDNRDGVFTYGYSIGGGVDVALAPNLFLRGEYEFVRFGDLNGVILDISTGRAGLAAKF